VKPESCNGGLVLVQISAILGIFNIALGHLTEINRSPHLSNYSVPEYAKPCPPQLK
jgi:hypothetical protein